MQLFRYWSLMGVIPVYTAPFLSNLSFVLLGLTLIVSFGILHQIIFNGLSKEQFISLGYIILTGCFISIMSSHWFIPFIFFNSGGLWFLNKYNFSGKNSLGFFGWFSLAWLLEILRSGITPNNFCFDLLSYLSRCGEENKSWKLYLFSFFSTSLKLGWVFHMIITIIFILFIWFGLVFTTWKYVLNIQQKNYIKTLVEEHLENDVFSLLINIFFIYPFNISAIVYNHLIKYKRNIFMGFSAFIGCYLIEVKKRIGNINTYSGVGRPLNWNDIKEIEEKNREIAEMIARGGKILRSW